MKKSIKRAVAIIILVAIFFVEGMFYVAPLRRAQAIPVVNVVHTPVQIAEFASTMARWIKEDMWKTIRDRVVNMLIQKVRDDIINSILNGGTPRFVTDWKGMFNSSVDMAFNVVNDQLKTQGLDLCGPFAPQLQIHLARFATAYNSDYNQMPPSCTIADFTQNIQNTATFIQRGGWLSFDAAASPQGNYIWMTLQTQDAFMDKMLADQAAKANDAIASKGFLGKKSCTDYGGGFSADSIQQNCTTDGKVDQSCVDYATQQWCTSWKTETPGDVVAQSLTQGINSDFPYMAGVQSAISAIVNTVITAAIDKGLTELSSTMGGGSGGSGVSYSGTSYTVPGGSGVKEQTYASTVDKIKADYTGFISYVGPGPDGGLQDALNQLVAKLHDFESCASTTNITFVDQDGQTKTELLSDLTRELIDFSDRVNTMYVTATQGLIDIAALDYSSATIDGDVQNIVDTYNTFAQDPFFGTVEAKLVLHENFVNGDYGRFMYGLINQLNTMSCMP